MRLKTSLLALTTVILATALPLGCASRSSSHDHSASAGEAVMHGNVIFNQAIPSNARLSVFLVENTDLGNTVEVLGNVTLSFAGGSPAPFSLAYNPSEVEPENRYTLVARVTTGDGRVLMKSNGYLVLTRGGPSDHVDLTLMPAR